MVLMPGQIGQISAFKLPGIDAQSNRSNLRIGIDARSNLVKK